MQKINNIKEKSSVIIGITIIVLVLFAWFLPLFQGMRYGLLPLEQRKVFAPEEFKSMQKSIANNEWSRYRINVNPDFSMLQVPKQHAINDAIQSGSVPLFDRTRLLGLTLLGHPLTDPFNPVNFLVAWFDSDLSIILKGAIYAILGLVGFLLLLNAMGLENKWYGIAGALWFVLSPNTIHYFHWDNYLGVVSLFPWALLGLVELYRRHWIRGILILGISNALMIIINMLEVYFYAVIGFFVFTFFLFGSSILQKRAIAWRRLIISLLIAITIAGLLRLPQLVTTVSYQSDMARQAESIVNTLRREPYLPANVFGFAGIFGFPLDPGRFNQHMTFFTLTILALIIFSLSKWKKMSPPIVATAGLFVFLLVFNFIGYLDLPLMVLPFYRKLANQMRMLHYIYATSGILLVFALRELDLLVKRRELNLKRFALGLFTFQILAIVYFGVRAFLHIGSLSNVIFNPWFLAMLGIICLQPLLIWCPGKIEALLKNKTTIMKAALIFLPLIFLGKIMLPFSNPADNMERSRYLDEPLPVRTIVIDSKIEKLPPTATRAYSGSMLWSLGEASLTGYDTGLQSDEHLLLHQFWHKKTYRMLASNPRYSWMHLSDYWVVPDPKKIIKQEGRHWKIPGQALSKLKLFGVARIYSDYEVVSLPQSGDFHRFKIYETGLSSPVTFVKNGKLPEIVDFVSSSDMKDKRPAYNIISLDKSSINQSGQNWTIKLPGSDGVLIIPFALKKYFTLSIDGRRINVFNGKTNGSPLIFLKVTKQMRELTLSPDIRDIYILWWIGILGASLVISSLCVLHFSGLDTGQTGLKI